MEECFIAQPRLTAEFVIGAECVVADPPLPATVCGQPLIREPFLFRIKCSPTLDVKLQPRHVRDHQSCRGWVNSQRPRVPRAIMLVVHLRAVLIAFLV